MRDPFLIVCILLLGVQARGDDRDEIFFEREIRPILATRCTGCHGSERQESDLRLDSVNGFRSGGASGVPLVGEHAGQDSLILRAVRREDQLAMPPQDPLPARELALLERWIAAGAVWPEDAGVTPKRGTLQDQVADARREHWAFQPIAPPRLPDVADRSWPRTPLDRFVLAQLEAKGLTPSREAGPRTQLRRVMFNMLGVPPTMEQVRRFQEDPRPDRFERIVDQQLASPQYGERWARHWLDVARYADTRGYAFGKDASYPFAFTYRDYVIRSLNDDLPYDRFVLEQLAADHLELPAEKSSLAALGFLTVGRRLNNVHDDIDDRIDVVTRGLLGLTVACARCHDHKYDAIGTADYYGLYGIFDSCYEPQELPLIGKPAEVEKAQAYLREFKKHQDARNEFVDRHREQQVDLARRSNHRYLVAVLNTKKLELLERLPFLSLVSEELRPELIARWRRYLKDNAKPTHPVLMPWARMRSVPNETFVAVLQQSLQQWKTLPDSRINKIVLERLETRAPKTMPEMARVYGDLLNDTYQQWRDHGANEDALKQLPDECRSIALLLFAPRSPTDLPEKDLEKYLDREHLVTYHQLNRNLTQQQGKAPVSMPRAMVLYDKQAPSDAHVLIRGNPGRRGERVPRQFISLLARRGQAAYDAGSGRLQMARDIVDPANPLTARVIANRIWMHHFGEPLVDTPSDFGVRCEKPVHAALLDYLAYRLQQQGWSWKSLHREILLSATYRQSSADREHARRGDASNRLLWRMNRRRLEFEAMRDAMLCVSGELDTAMGGKSVRMHSGAYRPRRSIYGYVNRQDLPNLLRVFDFASPDQSAARRARTTVPQRALFMMNSSFVARQVAGLTRRVQAGAMDDALFVRKLFEHSLARSPRTDETHVLLQFLRDAGTQSEGPSAREQLSQMLLMSNEFVFVD